jgi:hypothetical protein
MTSTSPLHNRSPILAPALLCSALLAVQAAIKTAPAAPPATQPLPSDTSSAITTEDLRTNSLRWIAGPKLNIEMPASSDYRHIALKDPSVVRAKDAWHVYTSWARSIEGKTRYGLAYFTCKDLNQTDRISAVPVLPEFSASAPQVFFFPPQQRWYLFYKVHDGRAKLGGFCFGTLDDVDQPASLTRPQLCQIPYGNPTADIDASRGLDSFLIGDGNHMYLFYSDNRGHQFRTRTNYADFPQGWAPPEVVITGPKFDVFEACCVYRLKDSNSYMLIIEALGRGGARYFRTYLADRLDGDWRSADSAFDRPFAGNANTTFAPGVTPWTVNISHGELIRAGNDERMLLDTNHLQFLIQGWDGKTRLTDVPQGKPGGYHEIPWQLGVLTATPAPPPATRPTR